MSGGWKYFIEYNGKRLDCIEENDSSKVDVENAAGEWKKEDPCYVVEECLAKIVSKLQEKAWFLLIATGKM